MSKQSPTSASKKTTRKSTNQNQQPKTHQTSHSNKNPKDQTKKSKLAAADQTDSLKDISKADQSQSLTTEKPSTDATTTPVSSALKGDSSPESKADKTENASQTKSKNLLIHLLDKHTNKLIGGVALAVILVGGGASYFIYQQNLQKPTVPTFVNQQPNTPANTTEAKNSPETKLPDPELQGEGLEIAKKLSVKKELPGLENFSINMLDQSPLPRAQVEPKNQDGWQGGLESIITTDYDANGQRDVIVQTITVYDSVEKAQNLKISEYQQDDFEKLDCAGIGEECSLFYRKSPPIYENPINTSRIFFRQGAYITYIELAQTQTYPEHDVEWLKTLAKTLLETSSKK